MLAGLEGNLKWKTGGLSLMSKAITIKALCGNAYAYYIKDINEIDINDVLEVLAELTSKDFAKGYSEQLRLSRDHATNAADLLEIELRKL